MENKPIVVLLKDIKRRVLKDGESVKVTHGEFDMLLDSWESWVLDNAIYSLGVTSEELAIVKNINNVDKLLTLIKSPKEGLALLATLRYLSLKNDYYCDYIMRVYFKHE